MNPVRIALLDDHALVRAGMRALLATVPGAVVSGEAANCEALMNLLATHPTDVVFCDLQLPGPDGIECIARIAQAHPSIHTIVVSMDDRPETVRLACSRGAKGFLPKMADAIELEMALQVVLSGGTYLSPKVTRALLMSEPETPQAVLTNRQTEILTEVAGGRSSREIAALLGVSSRTVEMHRARIMERLDLNDVAALTRYAMKHRLVE